MDDEYEITTQDAGHSLIMLGEWPEQELARLKAEYQAELHQLSRLNNRTNKTFLAQHTATGRSLLRRAEILQRFKAQLDELEKTYSEYILPSTDEDISTQHIEAREWIRPLLLAAQQMGGSATTKQAVDFIRFDLQAGAVTAAFIPVASSFNRGDWQRLVTSARRQMLAQGLVHPGPPRGYIIVTEEGQKFLEESEDDE